MKGLAWRTAFFRILGFGAGLAFGLSSSRAESPEDLKGRWQFTKIIYRSQEFLPEPTLYLTLELGSDNRSILYWTYNRGSGFCEGRGIYEWDGHLFRNRITWLNPLNLNSCQADPSLRLGQESATPAWLHDGNLHLDLGLGSESFVYVWAKVAR